MYGEVQCTQEQQKVLANNWRATILKNMWTDAMNMLTKKKKKMLRIWNHDAIHLCYIFRLDLFSISLLKLKTLLIVEILE